MIVEHGVLDVRPGQEEAYETALAEALPFISSSPGFLSLRIVRGIESPSRYVLFVEWESVEAHIKGFRESPAYERWRELTHPFYEPAPQVEHFNLVASE